ncbi:MAG: tyrosine-protein phosphatase [Erysipelotrichaceae bacterium]|nr:tyrosine-protein phosphatase [Erysipelotrichaceae bacterium]MBQ1523251.1 tyrosine-protein phosphatase [Erysipelotrichaceae bacterium]
MKRILAALLALIALIPFIGVFTNDPEALPPEDPPVIEPVEPEPEPDPEVIEEKVEITLVSPEKDQTMILVNEEMQEYLSIYHRGIGQNYYRYLTDHFIGNQTVSLKWQISKKPEFTVVYLSNRNDMKEADEMLCREDHLDICNLFTGKDYYWQICAVYSDYAVMSEIGHFRTEPTPRIVLIEGVSNTRDAGSYYTGSGSHLNQGLIYRTAYADNVTQFGRRQANEDLHIKTELDLRDAGESGSRLEKSPLGENVRYINAPGILYTNITKEAYWKSALNIFRVFADRENYPILVHCRAGRDRTGTAMIVLLGLCGVPEETIYKDYELSFFSQAGTEMQEEGREVEILLGYVNDLMKNLYKFGDDNTTLAGCCRNYLLKIGMTDEEIETIRLIMTGNAGIQLPHKKADVRIPEIRTYD